MRLRSQLLLVSLLMLALPWAGCQYVVEMENAQQRSQQDILLGSASVVASVLRDRPDLLVPRAYDSDDARDPAAELFARRIDPIAVLDGHHDDWTPLPGQQRAPVLRAGEAGDEFAVSYRAAFDPSWLFLHLRVTDRAIAYRDPRAGERAAHDHALVLTQAGDGRRAWLFATAAPGEFPAIVHDRRSYEEDEPRPRATRARGFWRDRADGYDLELRIPLDLLGERAGFAVFDAHAGRYTGVAGTLEGLEGVPGAENITGVYDSARAQGLVLQSIPLSNRLAEFQQTDKRLRILDRAGWALADAGSLSGPPVRRAPRSAVLERIFRLALDADRRGLPRLDAGGLRPDLPVFADALQGEPVVFRYRTEANDEVVIGALHPVRDRDDVVGAVLIEQRSDAILTLTQPALSRLLSLTLVTSFGAAVVLLGYATLLSWRIRRLRNAAEKALSPEGTLISDMPGDSAADELGDLSRSFSTLLERLREHNEYLRGLAGKLSHELRTPLAVVQSSLDNLRHEALPDGAEPYARRASEGIGRLSATLTAMSEASRVEQALESAEPESFDLAELIRGMAAAYRDVYPSHRIGADTPPRPCEMLGVPELLVQMLDKLVDNAADFTPARGRIEIVLEQLDSGYEIGVANEGPPLPERMRDRLFDSLVSVRERTASDRPHLGFGLYIARLIAEFHGGHIRADNLEDGSGVVFTARLATRPGRTR